MTCENFFKITEKDTLTSIDVEELQAVLKEFPYFQAARTLQLKGYYQTQNLSYNATLRTTAAYTTDRSILFDYITSEEFEQHKVSTRIKKRHQLAQKTDQPDDIAQTVYMNQEEAGKVLDPNLFEAKEKPQEKTVSPVQFNKEEQHSFSEWLQLTTVKPIVRTSAQTAEENSKIKREHEIIDRFIEDAPKIKPNKQTDHFIELKEDKPEERLMTQTLAQIYEEQNNYEKAIQAYKILILKNPEKSSLFADRIQEIESHRENKKK